jgi:hypothetical protein
VRKRESLGMSYGVDIWKVRLDSLYKHARCMKTNENTLGMVEGMITIVHVICIRK